MIASSSPYAAMELTCICTITHSRTYKRIHMYERCDYDKCVCPFKLIVANKQTSSSDNNIAKCFPTFDHQYSSVTFILLFLALLHQLTCLNIHVDCISTFICYMRRSCKFVSLMYWEELQIIISFKDLELERKSSNIFTVKDMNPIEIESIIMCIYSSILFALNKRSTKAFLSSATKGHIITIGLKAECLLPMAHGIRLHGNTLFTDHYHYTYVRRVLFLSN